VAGMREVFITLESKEFLGACSGVSKNIAAIADSFDTSSACCGVLHSLIFPQKVIMLLSKTKSSLGYKNNEYFTRSKRNRITAGIGVERFF
jgi:hypothetical protein